LRINSSGNVGIGTATPVNGKLVLSSSQSNSSDYTWLLFDNQASGYGDWNMYKSGNNNLAFGYGTSNGGSYTNALTLEFGGDVGIGDTTPSYKLDVNGTIRATGDVIAYSDKRVKENIKTIDNSLEKVNQLRGVEFNKIGEDKKSIGVIAQEIEKILPEVVREDDKGMKSVAYGFIRGILIEAIKELKLEVEELKKQIK
jgi:trimeric autotransporter adhesin